MPNHCSVCGRIPICHSGARISDTSRLGGGRFRPVVACQNSCTIVLSWKKPSGIQLIDMRFGIKTESSTQRTCFVRLRAASKATVMPCSVWSQINVLACHTLTWYFYRALSSLALALPKIDSPICPARTSPRQCTLVVRSISLARRAAR